LGYLGGLLLRKDRLDWGINEIADALLKYIGSEADDEWRRLTIFAAGGNSFAEMTEIIRLPFPDFTIWNLPIAVHELGHYHSTHNELFATKLAAAKSAEAQAAEEGGGGAAAPPSYLQKESYLHEFFADLFAVYTLGPAYAACCFVTRFSPGDKNFCRDGESHPSHAKRGYLLIEALKEMNKTSDPHFTGAITDLKNLWQRNLQAAGGPECADDLMALDEMNRTSDPPFKGVIKFNLLRELFYSVLGKRVSSAKYPKNAWSRARSLLDELPSGKKAAELVKDDDTIVDILNSAWAWRLSKKVENAEAVAEINRKALEMCRLIARRPSGRVAPRSLD
jgi:hypothetical protein